MYIIKNAVVNMSEHATTAESNKLYVVEFNNKTLFVNADIAKSIHDAVIRYAVRITKHKVSMRDSVYTLRSDIRALVKDIVRAQYVY